MRELDVYTLIFAATLIVFGALVSLFVLWRSQSRRDGAGFWVAGMASIAAGVPLIGLRGDIHDALSIVVANMAVLLGFILILRGIRVFAKKPVFRTMESPPKDR